MSLKSLIFALLVVVSPAVSLAEKAPVATAEGLISEGKDLAAISVLKRAVQEHPDAYQAWFLLGVTQARKRHFDDAIAAFGKVVQLQPELAEPHNNLAVIYNEMGNLTAAVRELEASLKLNPDYVTAHENIGDLYVKLAARSYKEALSQRENAQLRSRYENLLLIRKPATVQQTPTEHLNVETKREPVVAATDASSPSDQALAAIEAWRIAWSSRDLDAYFAAYAADFDPGSNFDSVAEWKAYKQAVISKRSFINVTINNIVVSEVAAGEIKAVFLQNFIADSFQSNNQKELLLKRVGERWKITHELSN
ncbi:tetratricopeptide repeat protein [Mariprofundus sp. KV]|uniref:L,D-transpeptidase Cds6 family protein n=1 Tax=Mariprofundus sp. KV TaxID=2608715 RepID=UPI0015A466DD|nr:tetratricopeptide repeat protein [Mariprofundus sp. KV]NWF36887.1 tetratricopeptide repeat protein [Mariprofundus sp. KV]